MVAIVNANLVLENGILFDGKMLVADGRIAAFGQDLEIPEGAEILDAQGAYVGPGFVDIHVHGGGGFSTCHDPEKAAAYFLRHGETTILATTDYHMNRETLLESIAKIKAAMVHTPTIKGIYMEGPYTNPDYGSHADKNPWRYGVREEDYKPIADACGQSVRVWTVAPEREDLLPFLTYAKQVNPNAVIAVGHSEATPMEIRDLGKYRPTLMTHCMNATGRKLSCKGLRGYGPDEYCFKEAEMYAELICDSQGIHVHPEMQQLLLHTKGVNRVILVTDSTVYNNPVPEQYAHVQDLNFDHNGGIAGSKLTMDMACRNIMCHTNCGIAQAFLMASTNPARAVGLEDVGSVAKGKVADLVFVDDKFNVQKVMLAGKICRFEEV
ncbi:MAG: hypothetical protein E7447_03265 [Ruminococcaceae bacterium]|nr:hypothetical protein [Oscillospiraceae bacterium]